MPDKVAVHDSLDRYLKARVPLIVVRSTEPNRVMDLVRSCAGGLRAMTFYEHSRTEGIREMLTGQSVSDETSLAVALEQARTTFKSRTNVNFVFTEVEDLDQETTQSRHFAEMVRLAESRSCCIVVVSAKPVWPGLARLGMTETLDLPTTEELAEVLGDFLETNRGPVTIDWEYDDLRQAAEILSGITEMEAINVLASMMARGRLTADDIPELSRYKDKIFGDLSGIERIHLREDYEVGGLHTLRDWLKAREPLMRADLSQHRFGPPRGVLLVGVPGCGKSLSAKAIAQQWNLPLYRLDMAGILGMYVGQSESQLREALETADRVAPCVLWIDEIEKALAQGPGDSGTTRRLVGQFLFWLQESTSKAFMVATANEVTSLPPELLRKGRFDEIFFVDLPDASDREEIVRLYFTKYFDHDPPPTLVADLVDLSDGFSGSDIDAVVKEMAQAAFVRGTGAVPSEDEIRVRFTNVVPYSQTNAEDVALIRAWGAHRCLPAGSRPPDGSPTPTRRVVIT